MISLGTGGFIPSGAFLVHRWPQMGSQLVEWSEAHYDLPN